MRWETRLQDAGLASKDINPLTLKEQFVYPLAFYSAWQFWYLFITFTVIEKDKTLMTSMRYLAKDLKNPMTIVCGRLLVILGMYHALKMILIAAKGIIQLRHVPLNLPGRKPP